MAAFINKKIKLFDSGYNLKCLSVFLAVAFAAIAAADPALAGTQIDDIGKNVSKSAQDLPGLLSVISYLLALVFAVTGVLKLKEHVSNPTQVPLRTPLIRFLVGGALLALPMIYQAIAVSFNGGANPVFDPSGTVFTGLSGLIGTLAGIVPLSNLNNIFAIIQDSLEDIPGVISVVAYLLALLFGVSGLLRLKEHVEDPERVSLKEPVIRLLAGGALFALPVIYDAMFNLVGDAGIWGSITSVFAAAGMIYSSYGLNVCNPVGGLVGGASMGGAMCGIFFNAGAFPAFLTMLAYIFGLVLGVWGILKIKAHVLNPQQVTIWEGVSRLFAGGLFFALPIVIEVMRNTVSPPVTEAIATAAQVTGFNETALACDGTTGLDGALYCFMNDILTPMHVVINFFTTVAAFIFAMIGISRLMKGAQDGARAPGGLGTMMTFLTAGVLLSYNSLMRAATATFSMGLIGGVPITATNGVLQYTKGMTAAETAHAHTIISAILKFLIIVGLISFVRGIFIIRGVAEGNSQSSLMSGVTHMVGGALAVNLGPLINAVETTLGITTFGIIFS